MNVYKPDYVTGPELDTNDIKSFKYINSTDIEIILNDDSKVTWSCSNKTDKDRLFKYLNDAISFDKLFKEKAP